jgi:isoleucyl-tRNA synthetase
VDAAFAEYEPTKAGRLIQDFVNDQLSNWYVRLCRRRFWKSDDSKDKLSAYQTLYTCLETVAILGSPIAPFFMDQLFTDLNSVSKRHDVESVHLADFPKVDSTLINTDLEDQMDIAQRISSLVLALRKKEKIRVRQPLQKIMVPVLSQTFANNLRHVQDLILSEVNIKELELLEEGSAVLVKSIKPNFKTIGPKYGKQMKAIAVLVGQMTGDDIAAIESTGTWNGTINGESIVLDLVDFEIAAQDIPGWLVASEGGLTVALDITISAELKSEGIARELVNRVQNLRKDSGLEVTDKIRITVETTATLREAIAVHAGYVQAEVLATEIVFGATSSSALITDLETEGDTRVELVKE